MTDRNKNIVIGGVLVTLVIIGALFFSLNRKEDTNKTTNDNATSETQTEANANEETTVLADGTTVPRAKTVGTATSNSTALMGRIVPEIQRPTGYSNTDAFLMKDLVGKQVILVNFWTYSSINSMRTFPYINQWQQKFRNKGLTIVSIHTPRFAFERDKDNVDRAAFANNITNRIVLDNEYGTWNNWGNKEWPTQYLVDINGRVVYTHKGEGDYESMEAKIQQLLVARATKLKLPTDVYAAFETPLTASVVDLAKIKSTETFFGAARNTALVNGIPRKEGMVDMKPLPTTLLSNALYLTGSWTFTKDYASSAIENNKILFKYNAKNVYAVFGAQKMNKVRVSLDGAPLTPENAGKDVRIEKGGSYLYVTEERTYDIVKGTSYGEHSLEMVAETSGLEVYVLMFG